MLHLWYSVGDFSIIMAGNNKYPSRDFSDNELKLSSWISSHYSLFKQLGIGSLMALDAVFVGLFFFGIYRYAVTYEDTEIAIGQLSEQLIDWETVRIALAPKKLVVDAVTTLPLGLKTDFVSRITNINEGRWGDFEYRFVWSGGETPWTKSFILPLDSKYLLALGNDTDVFAGVTYEMRDMQWHSLTQEQKERYAVIRGSVVTVNATFVPNVNKELTGVPISGVELLMENRSPFDFQDIQLTVILTNGLQPTAVNRATISRLERGEQKLVRTRWDQVIGGGKVQVEVDVNYLDDAIIAPPTNETSDAIF